jgi:uncharacterized protein
VRTVKIWNATNGHLVAGKVRIADTSWSRMRGLLGTRSLCSDEGLWIRPSSGVHTFGMAFAIDVVGLDRNGKVIRLWNRLAPHRVTSLTWRMHSVIELSPGRIAETGIHLGDSLRAESGEQRSYEK